MRYLIKVYCSPRSFDTLQTNFHKDAQKVDIRKAFNEINFVEYFFVVLYTLLKVNWRCCCRYCRCKYHLWGNIKSIGLLS